MLNHYSDKVTEELMDKMREYLKHYSIYELIQLVADVVATVETMD